MRKSDYNKSVGENLSVETYMLEHVMLRYIQNIFCKVPMFPAKVKHFLLGNRQ